MIMRAGSTSSNRLSFSLLLGLIAIFGLRTSEAQTVVPQGPQMQASPAQTPPRLSNEVSSSSEALNILTERPLVSPEQEAARLEAARAGQNDSQSHPALPRRGPAAIASQPNQAINVLPVFRDGPPRTSNAK
jgi:hypothetical protein